MTLQEFYIINKKVSIFNYIRIIGADCYFYKTKKALVDDYLKKSLLGSQLCFFDFDIKNKDKRKDKKEWIRKIMSFIDYDKVFESLLNAYQFINIEQHFLKEFEFENIYVMF